MKKNLWVALFLNIFVFGLGYIYLGRKIIFGVLLIVMEILLLIWGLTEPLMPIIIPNPLPIAAVAVFLIAISTDICQEAKKAIKSEQTTKLENKPESKENKPEQKKDKPEQKEDGPEQRIKKILEEHSLE